MVDRKVGKLNQTKKKEREIKKKKIEREIECIKKKKLTMELEQKLKRGKWSVKIFQKMACKSLL